MRRSNKKGFTIVELVIVIAVIAILAAVLIPTVAGIVKMANLSADQQAVSNMNKSAAMGIVNADNGKYEYASDVVAALYANGFNDGKLKTYSEDHHYAYDFENNKFYLLNEKDEVVFPADANVAVNTLWGFYSNAKTDKIAGVTKYIALDGINDQMAFDSEAACAFYEGEFTIDLNNKFFNVTPKNATITVVNGAVNKGIANVTAGADVSERELVNVDSAATLLGTAETKTENDVVIYTFKGMAYENISTKFANTVFEGEQVKVVFDDCTFISKDSGTITIGGNKQTNVDSYTFINCDFDTKNGAKYAVGIPGHDNAPDFTFEGCSFDSKRGINITADSGKPVYGKIVIDGCTFKCTDATPVAIQVATNEGVALNVTDGIEIKNNVFNCDIAVRAHEFLSATDAEYLKDLIVFSNNKISSDAKKVVGDTTTFSDEIAAAWLKLFN